MMPMQEQSRHQSAQRRNVLAERKPVCSRFRLWMRLNWRVRMKVCFLIFADSMLHYMLSQADQEEGMLWMTWMLYSR